MTPQSCLTCKSWRKHRPDADYGECTQIQGIERTLSNQSRAYVWASDPDDPGKTFPVALHTHKTFECAHYEQLNKTDNTLVDHLVEATRAAHGYPPKER